MNLTLKIKFQIEKYKKDVIIVEGDKDVRALKSAGFSKVYQIHNNKSIRESLVDFSDFSFFQDSLAKNDEKYQILTPTPQSHQKYHFSTPPSFSTPSQYVTFWSIDTPHAYIYPPTFVSPHST